MLQSITQYYTVLIRLIVPPHETSSTLRGGTGEHSNFTEYSSCHKKRLPWFILVTHERSSTIGGALGATVELHQISGLPWNMTSWLILATHVPRIRSRPQTSPNIARAMTNYADYWSSSHMKRPVQCAEQHASPCMITNYCSCHEILSSGIDWKTRPGLPSGNKNRFKENPNDRRIIRRPILAAQFV